MARKNRTAAKAAQRRKWKKARESRRGTVGELMAAIGNYLGQQGLAVNLLVDESDPGDRFLRPCANAGPGLRAVLELEFSLHTARGSADNGMVSRFMRVLVFASEEHNLIRILAPAAWSLEGASDHHRARLFENLLDESRFMPAGMRVEYHDGFCCPSLSLGLSEDQLSKKVVEALLQLLRFVALYDAAIENVLGTGNWVKPELPALSNEELRAETEELVGLVEEQMAERMKAAIQKASPFLERIMKHADGGRDGKLPLSGCRTNVVFAVHGRVTQVANVVDLDEFERVVESLVSRSQEPDIEPVTVS